MRPLDSLGDCVCRAEPLLACPHCGDDLVGRPALAAAHKRACHSAEVTWNFEHELTASCTWCGGAMKDDGREFCKNTCYRASKEAVAR